MKSLAITTCLLLAVGSKVSAQDTFVVRNQSPRTITASVKATSAPPAKEWASKKLKPGESVTFVLKSKGTFKVAIRQWLSNDAFVDASATDVDLRKLARVPPNQARASQLVLKTRHEYRRVDGKWVAEVQVDGAEVPQIMSLTNGKVVLPFTHNFYPPEEPERRDPKLPKRDDGKIFLPFPQLLFAVIAMGAPNTVPAGATGQTTQDKYQEPLYQEVFNGLHSAGSHRRYHHENATHWKSMDQWSRILTVAVGVLLFVGPLFITPFIEKSEKWKTAFHCFWITTGLIVLVWSIALNTLLYGDWYFQSQDRVREWTGLYHDWRSLYVKRFRMSPMELEKQIDALRLRQFEIETKDDASYDKDHFRECERAEYRALGAKPETKSDRKPSTKPANQTSAAIQGS